MGGGEVILRVTSNCIIDLLNHFTLAIYQHESHLSPMSMAQWVNGSILSYSQVEQGGGPRQQYLLHPFSILCRLLSKDLGMCHEYYCF